MQTVYSRETLDQVRPGLEQLLAPMAEAPFKDVAPAPDWDGYASAEVRRWLRIFTARLAGELIGCCAFLVKPNPHYKGSLQAVQDVLFVAPEHREGAIAAHLILFAERHLREEGVQVVYHKASGMAAILERTGYELVETAWAKRLDRTAGG